MPPDLLAGLLIGCGITLLVFVKLVAWGLSAAGKLFMDWISKAI